MDRQSSFTSTLFIRRLLFWVSLIVLSTIGCDSADPFEREPEPLIQTDALSYTLEQASGGLMVEIPYTYENLTGGPVYHSNCNGAFSISLERFEANTWKAAWYPFRQTCLSPPIEIREGEIWETSLLVWGAPPNTNTDPAFDVVDPTGVYRIVWNEALSSYQDQYPFGQIIDLEHRISNRFQLKTE